MLGRALKSRRAEVVITTKVGNRPSFRSLRTTWPLPIFG
jgi:aryl-alcohol dehydrogenase-like predicted oxidoreductase